MTRAFNGLMSFTPDGFPLLGESSAARGGYVPVELAEPGTSLAVHSEGAEHAVTVVSEPRFDPEGARLRELAGAAAG